MKTLLATVIFGFSSCAMPTPPTDKNPDQIPCRVEKHPNGCD